MNGSVKLLTKLVAIPSPSGDEEKACRHLADVLPSIGWERAEIDEVGNVVAFRGSGERELVLLGHIDTVPGGPLCALKGDCLWGRGSVDAKGPLCAFAIAGGNVPVSAGWRVTLVAAVGEETDSRGARHRIPRHAPEACIVGEPSGADGVTIGYRGCIRLVLSAEDGGAHRSGSEGPITATVRAASDLLTLVDVADSPGLPIIRRPSKAVVSMFGEEWGRRTGRVELDLRLPEGCDPQDWLSAAASAAERRGVSIGVLAAIPPHVEDKDNAAARALRLSIRRNGLAPRILAKGGTADFNLAAAWKCPMAAYGPGDSRLDHTDEEHLPLSEYETSIAVLSSALPLLMKM